jgi:hypothetical protein
MFLNGNFLLEATFTMVPFLQREIDKLSQRIDDSDSALNDLVTRWSETLSKVCAFPVCQTTVRKQVPFFQQYGVHVRLGGSGSVTSGVHVLLEAVERKLQEVLRQVQVAQHEKVIAFTNPAMGARASVLVCVTAGGRVDGVFPA